MNISMEEWKKASAFHAESFPENLARSRKKQENSQKTTQKPQMGFCLSWVSAKQGRNHPRTGSPLFGPIMKIRPSDIVGVEPIDVNLLGPEWSLKKAR
jgi:hypothetical protein